MKRLEERSELELQRRGRAAVTVACGEWLFALYGAYQGDLVTVLPPLVVGLIAWVVYARAHAELDRPWLVVGVAVGPCDKHEVVHRATVASYEQRSDALEDIESNEQIRQQATDELSQSFTWQLRDRPTYEGDQ